ncbi:hypothetical protein [Streptomyces agglomeratus]|uniref:hypothetical protein n=1 Tax=Streptomyces agglomeratus TaxID=285458 RepID=UPI000854B4B1|nr:hypothetical protein [Streptomyces agglomeratus]OEJ36326.1 hypothetical protein BGK72_38870 [Streptomyces agglomeratus]
MTNTLASTGGVGRPEPDDAHRKLGSLLLRIVREHDARIPAGRRAPRTLQEMRARLEEEGRSSEQ